ncbi:MAG: bifunctional [glutamine synthetase] adenylyltransferase/[glutamine synthetase]-adenylyl-L-tyrosine phosphorylase, partial [Aeromicrobium sp.]
MASETLDLTLARRGFRNGESAAADLKRLPGISEELVEQIAGVAAPDTALSSLAAIADSWDAKKLLKALEKDDDLRQRLLVVLGTSEAFGSFLARHPEALTDLGADTLSRTPPALDRMRRTMETASAADELRVTYRRALLGVAARDLTALTSFEESSAELADLAVATLGAALAIGRAGEEDAARRRLASIAPGETSGRKVP